MQDRTMPSAPVSGPSRLARASDPIRRVRFSPPIQGRDRITVGTAETPPTQKESAMRLRIACLVLLCSSGTAFAQVAPPNDPAGTPPATPPLPSQPVPPAHPTPPKPIPPISPSPRPAQVPTPAPTPLPPSSTPHTANPQNPSAPVAPLDSRRLQGATAPTAGFAEGDTNHDGFLSAQELQAMGRSPAQTLPTNFKALDKNGDGRISAEEWAQRDRNQTPPG
jgi:hypothetical protein